MAWIKGVLLTITKYLCFIACIRLALLSNHILPLKSPNFLSLLKMFYSVLLPNSKVQSRRLKMKQVRVTV